MKVVKWGNSLAIRIPAAIVAALDLKEGDDIQVRIADIRTFDLERDDRRARALEGIRKLSRPFPEDWKFGREDANAR